jgi:cytochrome c-type biogenesis protein CcmF
VENSSLVPWLVSVAAIHTTLSQRKSGAFIKTNLILGMMTFLFVLYSTFLTRSGVLGDTSVHSFVDPGMTVYWLLVGTLVFFSGLGATLVFLRRKELPRPQVRHDFSSREFALFLGASALFCSAILVTAGTSAPLIADILQKPKSAVDISYYVTTNLPLGIAIGLLAGVGQLLWWNRSNLREFFSLLRWPAGLALLSTIAVMLGAGAHTFGVAVLVFAAAFALWANLQVGWRIVQGNPKYAGGAVAHVGLAVLILGFVASSAYDTKETLSLPQGEPKQSLGYTLTYLGHAQLPNDKYAFRVQVEKDGHHHVAAPVMFTAKNSENIMRTPDIINMVTRDFYLAPMSLEEGGGADTAGSAHVVLRNGESTTVRGLGVAFLGFDLPADQRDAMMQGRQARLGARLKVTLPNGRSTEIVPAKIVGDGVTRDDAARAGGRYEFTIARMFQDASSGGQFAVEVHLQDLEATQASNGRPPVLVVEASVKPYINLVWSGVIIVLVGFGITLFRRGIEAKLRAP